MKLSSEPDLVVLGSRIYGDSGCKDAEVFSLSAIAHPSIPSPKNPQIFHFSGKVGFRITLNNKLLPIFNDQYCF